MADMTPAAAALVALLEQIIADTVEKTIARLAPHLTGELVSLHDEAKRLGMSTKTLKRDLARRGVPTLKIGVKVFARRADLSAPSAAPVVVPPPRLHVVKAESEDEKAMREAAERLAKPRTKKRTA